MIDERRSAGRGHYPFSVWSLLPSFQNAWKSLAAFKVIDKWQQTGIRCFFYPAVHVDEIYISAGFVVGPKHKSIFVEYATVMYQSRLSWSSLERGCFDFTYSAGHRSRVEWSRSFTKLLRRKYFILFISFVTSLLFHSSLQHGHPFSTAVLQHTCLHNHLHFAVWDRLQLS